MLWVDKPPGSSLVKGTPLGACWDVDGGDLASQTYERMAETVTVAVATGYERTPVQDVAFGMRQLTDVANKALSPGINDPTTAVHALGHAAGLLCQLATRELGSWVCRDEQGRVRVVLRRPDLAELLELAVDQPRRYGAGDPWVLGRIAVLLGEVAWSYESGHERRVIAEQLTRLARTVSEQDFDDVSRERLAGLLEQARRALSREWAPTPVSGTSHRHD